MLSKPRVSLTLPNFRIAPAFAHALSRGLGSSLRLCRKASKGSVQNDGRFFDVTRKLEMPPVTARGCEPLGYFPPAHCTAFFSSVR